MVTRHEILTELAKIGAQDDAAIDLGEAALLLGFLDQPKIKLDDYRAHIDKLHADIVTAMQDTADRLENRVDALRKVMVAVHHYHGDSATYDDLQNASLLRVIDRRIGLPITLGILYLVVCRRMGWDVEGLNFPGHFLLRLQIDGERIIIDPFHDAQEMDVPRMRQMLKAAAGMAAELTPEHYLPMNNREILLRLENNIKLRLVQTSRLDLALQTVEVMQAIAPDEVSLWRDRGMLFAAQGEMKNAIDAMQTFHDRAVDAKSKQQAQILIQQLKGRLN